jgi:hypothetical protein
VSPTPTGGASTRPRPRADHTLPVGLHTRAVMVLCTLGWWAWRRGWLPFLALAMTVACQPQTTTRIAISPSARPYLATILAGRNKLNAELNSDTFTVHEVDSDRVRDGEAVVIVDVTACAEGELACTLNAPDGVTIWLATTQLTPRIVAHELGHAAGLEHVPDKDNPDVLWQQLVELAHVPLATRAHAR